MEFTRSSNGTLAGQVVIQPDGGERSSPATFESVKLEGNTLKAIFKYPNGNEIEVNGKLESRQLRGTWRIANSNDGGSRQTTKAQ